MQATEHQDATSLTTQPLMAYLDRLASGAPTPGGGSVAACIAAQGAALLGMVLNLTVGRRRFAQVEATARTLLTQTEALRQHCTTLIDQDALVLGALIACYKLPKETPDERTAREAALQRCTQDALAVPLAVARAAAALPPLCAQILPIGNPTAVSDIGVAAACAAAAFDSAELNILINLSQLTDQDLVASVRAELATLRAELDPAVTTVLNTVRDRLA